MHLIEKNVSFTMCATLKVYKSDWHFSRGLLGGVLEGVGRRNMLREPRQTDW